MTSNATTTWTQTVAGNKDFVISHGYLDRADITVELDDAPKTVDVDWEWVNANLIRFIITAPAVSAVIEIIRITPHASLYTTFTANKAITSGDLNNQMLQIVYYAEEVEDAATA